MNNSLPAHIVALSIFLLASCTQKSIPISSESAESIETARLDIAELDFTYMAARSRVKYADQATNFTATANIRMLKDSLIWFSLSSSIGIEAIRGIISKDSILIMDRLKKTYFGYNFESLSTEFNFPLTFGMVQAMLLGKMSGPIGDNDMVKKEKGYLVLQQKNGSISVDNFIDKKTFLLIKVLFSQEPKANSLSLEFANFKPVGNILFPHANQIKVDYADKGNILNTIIVINYSKVLFEEKLLKFPFSIPSKYEPK